MTFKRKLIWLPVHVCVDKVSVMQMYWKNHYLYYLHNLVLINYLNLELLLLLPRPSFLFNNSIILFLLWCKALHINN